MTPYYERDGITIYCGECSQVMRDILPDNHIDLTVTSPPYDNLRTYNGYTFDFEAIAAQLWRVTTAGGVVVWVVADATVDGSETCTSDIQKLYFRGLGFNVHDTMIYQTDKPPMNDNRYQACFEFMFVFSKGKPKSFNPIMIQSSKAGERRIGITYRQENNSLKKQWRGGTYSPTTIKQSIWYYPAGGINVNHPAPFPEALARDHIISWSNPGDLVLDPMLGSGTTAKMAQQLGRRCIGIEISEEYCRIAVDRLRQPSFFSLPTQPAKVEAEQAVMSL